MNDPFGLTYHASTTHVDARGMPVGYWYGDPSKPEGWSYHPTPCCGAAASINDGPMYCKKCYHTVPNAYGGVPREPILQVGAPRLP
jgi:hypothetical protein